MPVHLQCDDMVLTEEEIVALWQQAITFFRHADEEISVRCVSQEKIRSLNAIYRLEDRPTNVLTFSYGDGIHDIALCMEVASREAEQRAASLRDYTALLLVHAFLHALGLDHERSAEEAEKTAQAQRDILHRAGFSAGNL